MRIAATVLAMVVTVGCGTDDLPTPPAPHQFSHTIMADDQVTLSIGPCYGACPQFSVTLSGSGALHWEGRKYVAVIGTRNTVVTRSSVEMVFGALADGFEEWFELEHRRYGGLEHTGPDGTTQELRYGVPLDTSEVTLTVRRTKDVTQVISYGYPTPRELSSVETELRALVASWIRP